MTRAANRVLSNAELDDFARELDALRTRTVATLGQADADYIRAVIRAIRYCGLGGRVLLIASAIVSFWWPAVLVPGCLLGVLLLTLSKILENMELGHNVMHGQYDWMRDPHLDGHRYEWDIAGTSDNWRKTHNFHHHTWTNVRGMDDDVGYGLLRLFPEQRWKPRYLLQPAVAVIFALLFEWGIAVQDLRLGRWLAGRTKTAVLREQFRPVGRKMTRQIVRDYLVFPLLAGPGFVPVLLGSIAANVLRNLWTYMIIFCGHFTADAETFSRDSVTGESRGRWYLRQLRGSSNLSGGRALDLLSGNLSHQIEHHLFPDVPGNRYAAMAVEVRAICARYGQHYNTGSLPRQFSQVLWRIVRHAFPSRPDLHPAAAELALPANGS
ncbi:MAG: acyl-CoA desaturase [Rhodanobacteraceae bacterium]|nr:acyl-CoA desaturase [Rhodanobacteraceae bacterium]MBL0040470.1 acyl-CoA desaturase [Xanthomonadales bacterium]MBP6079504.1 acyl-CoA desaturase [Xanthomonadales bacterium]MBP6195534.1 acyl-CoA desaturase [Methyloversatilis sp.]MBP7622528.1 acyl-CoA desaturase [Xanthomonadales bacterium]